MTADLDILVSLDRKNLEHLLAAMDELGYRPRLPVPVSDLLDAQKRRDWLASKNLHAFTFWNQQRPFEEIDVLLSVWRQYVLPVVKLRGQLMFPGLYNAENNYFRQIAAKKRIHSNQ
jgi:hypothetical protein